MNKTLFKAYAWSSTVILGLKLVSNVKAKNLKIQVYEVDDFKSRLNLDKKKNVRR